MADATDMASVEYRPTANSTPITVEYDDHLRFWPVRARGVVEFAGVNVERSWRGATIREVLQKAASNGCVTFRDVELSVAVAAIEQTLDTRGGGSDA
jgi:2-keto-3-deoxy-L-rhamnonate aldolase RhmA